METIKMKKLHSKKQYQKLKQGHIYGVNSKNNIYYSILCLEINDKT